MRIKNSKNRNQNPREKYITPSNVFFFSKYAIKRLDNRANSTIYPSRQHAESNPLPSEHRTSKS